VDQCGEAAVAEVEVEIAAGDIWDQRSGNKSGPPWKVVPAKPAERKPKRRGTEALERRNPSSSFFVGGVRARTQELLLRVTR
jgi:hypothetical protein